MSEIKPEARIANLEKLAVNLGGRIEELSNDTAEEFKALRQDVKQLSGHVDLGFQQAHTFVQEHFAEIGVRFDRIDGRIDGLHQDVAELHIVARDHTARFERIEATQKEHGELLKEQGQLLREILERLPKQE